MSRDIELFVRHSGKHLDEGQLGRLGDRLKQLFNSNTFSWPTDDLFDYRPPARGPLSAAPSVGAYRAYLLRAKDPRWNRDALRDLENHPDDAPIANEFGVLPTIGRPGEQFVLLHTWLRYFGPDYLSSSWCFVRSVSDFLERYIEGGQIWYGSDSGEIMWRLDPQTRANLTELNLGQPFDPTDRSTQLCRTCHHRPMELGLPEFNHIPETDEVRSYHCDSCGLVRVVFADGQVCDAPDHIRCTFAGDPGFDLATRTFADWRL